MGKKSNSIDVFASRASGDENCLTGEIVAQPKHIANFLCDGLGGSEPSRAYHTASEVAFIGVHHVHAAFAQNPEVALGSRMVPHIHVHGRGDHHPSLSGQIQSAEKIFGNAISKFVENGRGSGRNQQQINSLRDGNMFNGAFNVCRSSGTSGTEHIRDYFLSGERGEGKRSDELLRCTGHHHLHVQLFLLQTTNQFRSFVSRNASSDAECDFHLVRSGCYFFRLPSLSSGSPLNSLASYSSRPFSNSSSAMRVVLRDRGLSTMGRPPIINCRARRATTTTYANWLSGGSLNTAMFRSASKGLQNFANSFFIPRHPASRAECNGLDFFTCALDIVVDDGVIVATIVQHLLARTFEPTPNFVFRILTTLPYAMFELSARRRQDEDCYSARQLLFYLQSALYVNFENQIFFLLLRFGYRFARSAVPMLSEHLGIFQEIAAFHHSLKLRLGDKIVPFALALRLARHARGARNR